MSAIKQGSTTFKQGSTTFGTLRKVTKIVPTIHTRPTGLFKKDLFSFHEDMMTKLKKIKDIKQIKIVQANFETGDISVTTETLYNKQKEGILPTYEEVIETIDFLRICDNFIIRSVDFISGNMLVKWIENPRMKVVLANLTQNEVDLIKESKKIECIKMIRDRTGMGLNDAKTLMEEACEYLVQDRE